MIRPANQTDLSEMADVTMRSKAHWGYDPAFLAACREELTPTVGDLGPGLAVWDEGRIGGVAWVKDTGATAELHALFIAPEAMGRGIGATLFDWCCTYACGLGADLIGLDADPFAEGFYLRKGMQRVGEVASLTWPDRMLPRMELVL